MKDLSTHTRLTPEQWVNRLNRFINNMSRNATVQTTLSTWGLSFENKLLNLTGRVLPAERILQGARAYENNPCDADWSKEMRGLPLMTSMPLEIWVLSHTRRNADVTHSLLQTLNKVPVGIHLQRPGMMEYDDRQEALQHRAVQQVQMRAGAHKKEIAPSPTAAPARRGQLPAEHSASRKDRRGRAGLTRLRPAIGGSNGEAPPLRRQRRRIKGRASSREGEENIVASRRTPRYKRGRDCRIVRVTHTEDAGPGKPPPRLGNPASAMSRRRRPSRLHQTPHSSTYNPFASP
ncbi:uncharacterized protein LOC108273513 [Ictalurus punctatus]|uniref:Uncharacterized protein LOC108273513 n=1 Tax=Ictalurus punctatus TaxID=7998 RepID=A0A9F7RFA5_ICTPU|nr:uncharacterized protein LOC108273513 [Ictalurus punctatus]